MNNERTGKWTPPLAPDGNGVGSALRRAADVHHEELPRELVSLLDQLEQLNRRKSRAQAAMS